MPHPVSSDRIWKEEEPRNYYDGGNDGLSLGGAKFRLGTALGMLEALETVRQDVIPGFKVPVMINHGTDDKSVLIDGSIYLFENCATPAEDKTLNKVSLLYLSHHMLFSFRLGPIVLTIAWAQIEGGYHDLYSQKDAEETMKLELKWINEQLAKK